MWWWAPVTPAIQEMRQGNHLNPGGRGFSGQDRATVLQPGQQSQTRPPKKKKNKKKKKKKLHPKKYTCEAVIYKYNYHTKENYLKNNDYCKNAIYFT